MKTFFVSERTQLITSREEGRVKEVIFLPHGVYFNGSRASRRQRHGGKSFVNRQQPRSTVRLQPSDQDRSQHPKRKKDMIQSFRFDTQLQTLVGCRQLEDIKVVMADKR
jgi:hypothetical protein